MSTELKKHQNGDSSDLSDRFKKKRNSTTSLVVRTNWRLIIVAGVISALNAVENSVIGIGEWPYMKTIDENAHAQFFGAATSASKLGHAVFAMVFSIWSYKSQSTKRPLLASRVIAIFACAMYLSIEYVPNGKRYVMMVVYILLGIANSATAILRAYIASISTPEDRPKAFAIIGLSIIVSLIVGPCIQIVFSGIPYPGYEVLPGIRFHIYSAPIWFSFILTIFTIFFITSCMDDTAIYKETSNTESSNETSFSIQRLRRAWNDLRKQNIDWKLIGVCLFVKIAATFSHATMASIMSIFFMVQYGWTGEQTVRAGSIVVIGFGFIAFSVLMMYIFCNLGKMFKQHHVFLFALSISILVFLLTYPYEFSSMPVAHYNETTKAGCDVSEYSWCENAVAVNPYFFMAVLVLFNAPSTPMLHTSLDTIYSKILENMDQSVAQGAMAVVDDIVYMVTPVFTTTVFTLYGVPALWIAKTLVYTAVAVVWIINFRRIGLFMKD